MKITKINTEYWLQWYASSALQNQYQNKYTFCGISRSSSYFKNDIISFEHLSNLTRNSEVYVLFFATNLLLKGRIIREIFLTKKWKWRLIILTFYR